MLANSNFVIIKLKSKQFANIQFAHAKYLCDRFKQEHTDMKKIKKTTVEFITYVVIILSCAGIAISEIWWVSTPAIMICGIRVYNIVKLMIKSKCISPAKVMKILSKTGYQAQITDEGEIVVESDGHMYSIFCRENGQIQFARSYEVPANQLQMLRKAAEQTMTEAYMAKIMIKDCPEPDKGFMVLSVETVCSSEKELRATLQQHMQAIDDAEKLQLKHTHQIQDSQPQEVERKRIGFL